MRPLNHLFSSTEDLAKDIKYDDETIIKHWNEYLSTLPRKKEIIQRINLNNLQKELDELHKLLDLDLIDLSDEIKEESELISDLEAVSHSKKIKRIHALQTCLGYAETKYKYVHELLKNLHDILKNQLHLILALQSGSGVTIQLIEHLKKQLELELDVIAKTERINERESFHNLFISLVNGEHIIKTMDAKEKRMLKRMQAGVGKIFTNEITEGITYEWAMRVYDEVQNFVMNHEAIIERGYDPHENIDFEFVNRSEFVELAKRSINEIKKKPVSEKMLNVFVHLFREWYNHERD